MQKLAFGVHLIEPQPASLGHAQAVPVHKQDQAAVALRVPAVFGGVDQFFDFKAGEVLPVAFGGRFGRFCPVPIL